MVRLEDSLPRHHNEVPNACRMTPAPISEVFNQEFVYIKLLIRS